ncbi:MAG: NOL1/NOP2/sun family putative RNA methylase [Candidatus Aenigmarchaeota archaeon]|nr:NOL1/NOP2/sun family putative RNA methylase [Candidatus Aenigmarchaeota archaeon]
MHKINLPRFFIYRYRKILGKEVKKLVEYSLKPLRKSIRINTLKISRENCLKLLSARSWELQQIPWYENGFWVLNRNEEQVGNTLEHFMGYFYVQEASSMIPPIVLEPKEDDFILDVAASPGSKTTQIAEMMKNKGCIIANDVSLDRIKILRFNLEKCGVMNTIVTKMDGRLFKKFKERFDKILLDAPCSSEGVIRKDWKVISRWSLNIIQRMSLLQKELISSAIIALKKGGVLVYSTCTMAPEENEEVIDYAIKNFDVEIEKPKIQGLKYREGITEWEEKKFDPRVKNSIRIWPQDNDTEGFFIAKLVKR